MGFSLNKIIKGAVIISALFLAARFGTAEAATLSLSPSAGVFEVGRTFSVSVFVSSPDNPVNAVSATVSFPTDLLQVVSITKGGSIITNWAVEPAISNANGTVRFEGVMIGGFQGSKAPTLAINFKAKTVGAAKLSISSGSVLAHDGRGTNVLDSVSGSTITIREAPEEPAPSPAPEKPVKPTPAPTPAPAAATIDPPQVATYSREIGRKDALEVIGVTHPNSGVTIYIKKLDGTIDSETVRSTEKGIFRLISDMRFDPGLYSFTADVTDSNGTKSSKTEEYIFVVKQNPFVAFALKIMSYTSVFLIIVICLAIALIFLLYIVYGLKKMRRKIRREILKAEDAVHVEFDLIKDEINKHLGSLQKASSKRELTSEESSIEKSLMKFIKARENDIQKMLDKIEKDAGK